MIKQAGDLTITAEQSGNNNYNPAPPVSRSIEILTILGLGNHDIVNVNIYPNPANEWIFIDLEQYKVNMNATLFDMRGAAVKTSKLNSNNNKIDLRDLKNGQYILKVFSKHNVVQGTFRVIIAPLK